MLRSLLMSHTRRIALRPLYPTSDFRFPTPERVAKTLITSFVTCAILVLSIAVRADDLSVTDRSFAASAVPDRVLLSWKSDPATTQSVSWRTDASIDEGFAEIAPAGPGPDFAKSAKRVSATSQVVETNLGESRYYSVTFENLSPKTLYAYRVGHDGAMSEWFQFRTAADEPAPLQFIYVGDAQVNIKSFWSRVIREAYAEAPRATFMLHAGDLVNRGDADHEWGEWFHALGWLSGSVPQFAVPGNHEYSSIDDVFPRQLSPLWRPQFEFPENGPMGFEETVYSIDIQGVRLIGLNSNMNLDIQTAWLEDTLANNPCEWTIVTHHHPIHSTSRGRDNEMLRRVWQPIYDKYGVDLVLQGHDHSYGRSAPLTRQTTPAVKDDGQTDKSANIPSGVRGRTPGGTVYVVSVSGPKMYDLKDYKTGENPFARRAANTQLFQIIRIDGNELRYEARTATGKLYDAFTLRHREGAPNEFIGRIPKGTPARRGAPEE